MSVVSVTAGPRRGWKSSSTWIGAVIVGIAAICALFAPLLAPYAYDAMHLPSANMEPDGKHWMGTDEFGRDLFSRILYGARVSLGSSPRSRSTVRRSPRATTRASRPWIARSSKQ